MREISVPPSPFPGVGERGPAFESRGNALQTVQPCKSRGGDLISDVSSIKTGNSLRYFVIGSNKNYSCITPHNSVLPFDTTLRKRLSVSTVPIR